MGFGKLIDKVHQAECALEARERGVGMDWRQLKSSWRAAWTPGRIVVAGLVSGFLVGRSRPLQLAGNGAMVQLITALSGVVASGTASVAAQDAEDASRIAERVTQPDSVPPQVAPEYHDTVQHHERIRRRGVV